MKFQIDDIVRMGECLAVIENYSEGGYTYRYVHVSKRYNRLLGVECFGTFEMDGEYPIIGTRDTHPELFV